MRCSSTARTGSYTNNSWYRWFLDGANRVLRVAERIRPWAPMIAAPRGTKSVLELGAGAVARAGAQVGDELSWEPVERM